jgi:hypothetical protein
MEQDLMMSLYKYDLLYEHKYEDASESGCGMIGRYRVD